MEEKRYYSIGTKVTGKVKKAMEELLAKDAHINSSDYLRALVREDLTRRGFLKTTTANE